MAPVGMCSRASGAARLEPSSCRFSERALALSELRLLPSAPSLRLVAALGAPPDDLQGA